MKTYLRLACAALGLLALTAPQVSAQPDPNTRAEVRQALYDTFDVLRQATWWNDFDGSFNPAPAEDAWCGDDGCGYPVGDCKPLDIWAQAEFLMWWSKGSQFPALVTTTNQPNVPRLQAGRLGFATTDVLLGNETLGDEIQSGGRLDLGIWLDPCHNVGLGVKAYGLEGDADKFFATSAGVPTLAIPFFNPLINQEDAQLIAYTDPGGVVNEAGSIEMEYNTSFGGTDVYTRIMMERCPINRVDLIGGYSYLRLADNFTMRSTYTSFLPIDLGNTYNLRDTFAAQNVIHGGMLGLMGTRGHGRWSLDWLGKVTLGANHQRVRIAGTTIITPPVGAPVAFNGGVFAQPSNIGFYDNSQTVVVPEITCNLTYHLSSNWSVGIGYNLLWISSVATAGRQIDRVVDRGQLIPRPAFADFTTDDHWLQGINMSLRAEF
jgi:hypothetical protein